MNTKDYLELVAYKTQCDLIEDASIKIYKSKFDDSYITHVGMEDDIKHLADREITQQLTHGVGFSPKDKKWYGWSHRAIFGFEIGSTCSKGDCHYEGSSLKEQEQAAIAFWEEKYHTNVESAGIFKEGNNSFFEIRWDYTDEIPNKSLRGTVGRIKHLVKPLGKGEWTAETMEDAKQMAIDFNQGVS